MAATKPLPSPAPAQAGSGRAPEGPIPFAPNGMAVTDDFNGIGFRYYANSKGLHVFSTVPGSSAAEVLMEGDFVTSIKVGKDWLPTTLKDQVLHTLRGDTPCEPVTFRVLRAGKEQEVTIPRQHFRDVQTPDGTKMLILDPASKYCGQVSELEPGTLTAPAFPGVTGPAKQRA